MYKSNVREVKAAITRAELAGLEAVGVHIDGDAKERCKVGQYDDGRVGGNLKGSLTHRVDPAEKSVTNGTNVEYGPFVEFGTGQRGAGSGVTPPEGYQYGGKPGMVAQPYLTPAYENRDAIRGILEEHLGTLSGEGPGYEIGVGGGST